MRVQVRRQWDHLQILSESLVKGTLEVGPASITPDDGCSNVQQDALIVEQWTCSMQI